MFKNTIICIHFICRFVGTSTQLDKPHLRKFGCNMASAAMVLKAIGAKTSSIRYDLRTNTSSYLEADPFTVTMANIGWLPVTYNQTNGHYEITGYTSSDTPCYALWSNIASSFGKTVYSVDLTGKTVKEKADAIDFYLNNHPGGIMVRIGGAHTFVVTAFDYSGDAGFNANAIAPSVEITQENQHLFVDEEISDINNIPATLNYGINSEYDSLLHVCDPATSTTSKGDNVVFTSSYSYLTYGGIENFNWIKYFN